MAVKDISASTPNQCIRTQAASEGVIAGAAAENVVTAVADERIVSGTTSEVFYTLKQIFTGASNLGRQDSQINVKI